MAKTAFAGPIVAYGNRSSNVNNAGPVNSDVGPGAIIGGAGLLDPRVGYNVTRKGWVGMGVGSVRVLSALPVAKGTAKLAALANVVSGVAMTLAVASTGITVLGTGGLYVTGSGNTVAAGALVIDGNPTLVNYGLADSNGLYNNNAYNIGSLIGRVVSITDAASATGGAFLVSGYDAYGYPMSELITAAAGVSTTNGVKAFKFITSIVPQFTDAHNYSVGTTDIFGLPLRADLFSQTRILWDETVITANTGFVAAVTTSPATTITGDVRGTYAVQSAADGVKRLSIEIGPGQANLVSNTGLFGVTQV